MSKIIAEDISFSYSQSQDYLVLDHVSASFDSEKITVLTGPSGCGKSTLLYLVAGIYPQAVGRLVGGNIYACGQEIGKLFPDKRCGIVGMMFQNPDLQFCMDTVENEIYFCLGNISTPQSDMEEIAHLALKFCGVYHLKTRQLHSLSGGEKQKVMLACLIALKPKWLLLDEPFANIDNGSAADLIEKLNALHKTGVGILVVDHRLDLWLPVADEIQIMNAGDGIGKEKYFPKELSTDIMIQMGFLAQRNHHKKIGKPKPITETVLKLEDITVIRGNSKILNQAGYEFQKEKIYAVVGDSGSGKSTLFSIMNGLYDFKGNIYLNGRNIRKNKDIRTGNMGFVTQNPQDQFVADTVLGEIEVSLKHRNKVKNCDLGMEIESILRAINLWGYRNFSPYMLSQGQQRRLGVAALLAYDCKVLVCDEPTYAQDWNNTIDIMDSLIKIVRERGMTLIFSTHDYQILSYADKVLQLKEGELHEIYKSHMQNDRNFNTGDYTGICS